MSYLLMKSMLISNVFEKKKTQKKKIQKSSCPPKVKYSGPNDICRTCNFEQGVITLINNKDHPDIIEDIHQFSGVEISSTDPLSKMMCLNCLVLLQSCIMFREMCKNSNKRLLEAVKLETVIKQEPATDPERSTTDLEQVGIEHNYHSDDSYNIPSPEFPVGPIDNDDEEICNTSTTLWKCEACNADFNDKKAFNRHITKCKIKLAKEKGTKRFLCDICGKTSHSNANLLAHMIIHENVFPFKCDSCPYQGRTQDLLNVHKRTHLPEKPYKCIHCAKTTTTSSNLAKHMRHVHSNTRPHKCSYCDKAFSYQHDMKRHVRDIHLRQSTVQCEVCLKKFNTKKILQGHRWKIHKIKGDKQGRMPSYLQCQSTEGSAETTEWYQP